VDTGKAQVLKWKSVAREKSRFRKLLNRGKNRIRRIKANTILIIPVSRLSAVNSAIISLFEAPFTILIPIPLILLPVIDE
jgi:hypothetical protein